MRNLKNEGIPIATIKDVAKLAGVSCTTVSHVINSTRKVNVDTAARVWVAIDELKFVPSTLAQGLRKKSSRTIGVISDRATNPFFSEVVAGIEEVCFKEDFSVFLSYSENDNQKENTLLQNLVRKRVEGLIIQAVQPDESLGKNLKDCDLPIILFQRTLPEWNRDSLCTDDEEGSRLVMDHLFSLGHRKIGFITGVTETSHQARLREFIYREMILSFPGNRVVIEDGQYSFEGGYQACLRLLSHESPPTALFCISDQMALGCLAALQDTGIRVPEDVSLVGYDNLELLKYIHPKLTTVDHQAREAGRIMARRLLERIKNPGMTPSILTIRPTLILRETTGPCRQK